jgi:hypothetical protein
MATRRKTQKSKKSKRVRRLPQGNARKGIPHGPQFPTFAKLYQQELEVPWNATEFDNKTIPAKLLLVRKRIARALKGSERAQDAIENRLEGMPKQTTEIQGSGSRPLIIENGTLTAADLEKMSNVESQGTKDAGSPS